MKSSAKKIELASVDDLFSTEEGRQDAKLEKIQEIPLSELHPFRNHPFKVKDDEAMMETADSIKQYGVLVPAIARPDPEGGYELVAGHRRHRASELAEKETMPVIVRDLDDDAATIIMAVFRIERTRDYTVMSNHHLRNANLSLKAKGLLSMMLSLPEDWNYTTRGLAKICKEGVDAIGAALRELEAAGYIVRHKLRDRQGRISDTEYVIYEQPQLRKPDTDSPDTENPYMDKPDTEKPAELNIEKSNTEKSITYGSSTDSIPFRETAAARPPERKGRDAMSVTEIENYRELILENIEYDCLKQRYPLYLDDLNEIVELLVETVCARRKTTRISGADFPHEIVRSRFLKLDSSHIEFVMDCLQKNTTQVRNMKQYLLAVLFNAPTTMNNHFTSLVNHDMHAGGW